MTGGRARGATGKKSAGSAVSTTQEASPANGRPAGVRGSTRRELVENEMYEHAARLFAERGFAGTSLQDVADAMGVTRPALYYYVKSKDELLSKLVGRSPRILPRFSPRSTPAPTSIRWRSCAQPSA